MSPKLAQLIERMTPAEQTEVEKFASYLLYRRQATLVDDEIDEAELRALVAQSGAFDWLADEAEDIYSPEDGAPVQWPQNS